MFPVKAPQLLQHMLQTFCLFENITGTSVLTYGKCLFACVESPVAERGQMSDGVPLALGGRESCVNKLLVWLLILCREWGTLKKFRIHTEALSSGYLAALRSQAEAGRNDTIVSRWLRPENPGIFSQERWACFYKWAHGIDTWLYGFCK